MKRQKNDGRIVARSFVMVIQFGLNMIVPIGIMSALGIWLDRKLGTSFLTIILFVAGAVAGGQNIYRMAKQLCGDEGQDKEQGVFRDKDDGRTEKDK